MGGEKEPALRPEILFVDKEEDFAAKTERVKQALEVAKDFHRGQFRLSGEAYVNHCVAVAGILESWGLKQEKHEELFCAALLHDTVEDTKMSLEGIEEQFGKEAAFLVDGVSKFRSEEVNKGEDDEKINQETLKKVMIRAYIEPGVALIKLADRLHNMRTLGAVPLARQAPKAWETLNVYVPLAESLGLWVIKTELEDLVFPYIDPERHRAIRQEIDGDLRLDKEFIGKRIEELEELMDLAGLEGELSVRIGGYWKTMKKRERMVMRGMSRPDTFADVNDLLSIGVKVGSVADCYAFLGQLRQYFGEAIDFNRSGDFIAVPRDNRYMALQEAVIFPQGAVEVAVMTKEIESFNNWGVVSLLNQGVEDLSDHRLKLLFTPAGEVRFFPLEANGIDFAAALNPRLLSDMVGIEVDGREWGLGEAIPNGTTVRVLVGEPKTLARQEWLDYQILSRTRRQIGEQLRQEEREALIVKGEEMIEEVLRERGLFDLDGLASMGDFFKAKVREVLLEFGCRDLDDLFYKAGYGALGLERLAERLDRAGIDKQSLGLTSVRIIGENKQGLLARITRVIAKRGGDILVFKFKWIDEDRYQLRLVARSLENAESEILEKLAASGWFEQVEVV